MRARALEEIKSVPILTRLRKELSAPPTLPEKVKGKVTAKVKVKAAKVKEKV